MAISTNRFIGPDETYHFQLIKLFAERGVSPILNNQNGYYFLGEVVHTPFTIYHYLLSFPFRIFGDSSASLFLLRGINILMACASLYVVLLIARSLRLSKLASHLSIFMLANTLMFVFLSSMINYDNLFVLLSLLSIHLVLGLSKKLSINKIMSLMLVTACGLLVKISFLPIALSSIIILLVRLWQTRQKVFKSLAQEMAHNLRRALFGTVTLTLMTSVLCGFAMYKYISNVVSYHTYSPGCEKVLTMEQCYENSVYKRNKILNSDAPPNIKISTSEYVSSWTSIMLDRTFGIFGHKITQPTKLIATWYQVLFALSVIAIIKRYRKGDRQTNLTLVIISFYTVTLIYNGYTGYHESGLIDLAIQGRYLFAVLPVMYLFANKYILELFSTKLKFVYVLATLSIFFTAGLPSYLIASDPTWYSSPTIRVNTKINQLLNFTDK